MILLRLQTGLFITQELTTTMKTNKRFLLDLSLLILPIQKDKIELAWPTQEIIQNGLLQQENGKKNSQKGELQEQPTHKKKHDNLQ